MTTLDAKQANLPSAGVLIQPNGKDSPVAQAGLTGQVVLTAVDGTLLTSQRI